MVSQFLFSVLYPVYYFNIIGSRLVLVMYDFFSVPRYQCKKDKFLSYSSEKLFALGIDSCASFNGPS